MPYIVSIALQSSLLTVLQVLWTLLLFDGLRRGRQGQIAGVVGGHYAMTALNMIITGTQTPTGCVYNISLSFCTAGLFLAWGYRVFCLGVHRTAGMQRVSVLGGEEAGEEDEEEDDSLQRRVRMQHW